MTGHVVVVGDANVDLIVNFPRFLDDSRQNVVYPTPTMHGGGTAANTAVALARLAVPTSFIGTIGNDSFGRFIIQDFTSEGVEISQLLIDPSLTTVVVFAFVDERGERYLWGWPRTEQAHREISLDRIDECTISEASWLHTTGMLLVHESTGRRAVLALLKKALDAGIPTSLDLNLRVNAGTIDPVYREVVNEAMSYCSVVLGSGEEEFRYLDTSRPWQEVARSLVTEKRSIVARSGAGGSILMHAGGEAHASAFPVPVADTVGAGDVYNAGFIAACLRGLPGEETLRWGNAVAACKVMRVGARGCPRLPELQEFLHTHAAAA